MAKRKGVAILVDDGFFNMFDKARRVEQAKLSMKMGRNFNLSQRNFTRMLSAKGFKFDIDKSKIKRKRPIR